MVCSGTMSPTLGIPIGTCYVPTALAKEGSTFDVEIRGKRVPATVVKTPFYKDASHSVTARRRDTPPPSRCNAHRHSHRLRRGRAGRARRHVGRRDRSVGPRPRLRRRGARARVATTPCRSSRRPRRRGAIRDAADSGADDRRHRLGPRDITPEATRAVSTAKRRASPNASACCRSTAFPRAALSRGMAGTRNRTLIINLPGSTGGVKDGLAAIDPIIDHAVAVLRADHLDH